MTKSRRRSATRARTQRRSRTQRGGENAPASAWGWQLNNLGNGWTQFMNSLSLQPGQNLGTQQSNAIVPQGNINAQNQQPALGPKQGGGRRRGRTAHRGRSARRSRSRRGGNLGAIVNQALLPATLIAMQQKIGKRSRKGGNIGAIVNQALLPASLIAMQQKIGKRSRRH